MTDLTAYAPPVLLAVQFALAFVFGAAAATKLARPSTLASTVRAYGLLPRLLIGPFAVLLMVSEVAVSLSLLLGVLPLVGLAAAATLLVTFAIGVSTALHRDSRIACGCFGSATETVSPESLARIGLMLSGVALVIWGHTTGTIGLGAIALAQRSGLIDLVLVAVLAAAVVVLAAWSIRLRNLAALLAPGHPAGPGPGAEPLR
jgi:hypothetical protein